MVMPHQLIFNTALPFPNQIHSSLPHPSLWQWSMVAFTRLSPLHISLPIRLTTRIHTHWLFIPLSLRLPQTPALSSIFSPVALSSSLRSTTPRLPPSCAISSNFLLFFSRRISNSEPLSSPLFVVFFSLLYWYPSSPELSIHSIWLRRQNTTEEWQRSGSIKRTSGLTVHTTAAPRGYVGVLLFLA